MLIDIHTHVAPTTSTSRQNGTSWTTPEELVALLDSYGIDMAVLLPMVSPEGNHRLVTTEEVLAITDAYPGRFIPFCNIDPRQVGPSSRMDFEHYLSWYRQAGCRGVGELTANLSFDDPLVEQLFSQCEALDMPVLFHIAPRFGGCYGLVDDLGLPRLERSLAAFPKLTFLGHSPAFWSEISSDVSEDNREGYPKGAVRPGRVVDLLRRYPNLVGDLSAGSGFNAISRDPEWGYGFLEEFQDRLLFGTDICFPKQELPLPGYLRRARDINAISEEACEKIAWRNANRILRLGLN